jgi:ribulose-phosphate 3-epimerase
MQITDRFQFPVLAPSIIAADELNLESEIQNCINLGVPWLHCDVMDGHFVPNITFGPDRIKAIKKKFPEILCDAHLMVSSPSFWLPKFLEMGADVITVHVENCVGSDIATWSQQCKDADVLFGLAIRPTTDLSVLKPWVSLIQVVNVMSVYPGFYGQKFMEGSPERIKTIRSWGDTSEFLIKVDGGINLETAQLCLDAGTDIFVMGGAFFKASDRKAITRDFSHLKRP